MVSCSVDRVVLPQHLHNKSNPKIDFLSVGGEFGFSGCCHSYCPIKLRETCAPPS